MTAEDAIQKLPDIVVGAALTGGGTAGFTIQALVEWGNLFVTVGNIVLVFGGVYIMFVKVRSSRRMRKQQSPTQ
jgi:fructose-specific phosphotransferase system IIC component